MKQTPTSVLTQSSPSDLAGLGRCLALLLLLSTVVLSTPALAQNATECGADYHSAINHYGGFYNAKAYPHRGVFAALKSDGSITAWGSPDYGASGAPTGSGYTHIVTNYSALAALHSDGHITAWGHAQYGVSDAPTDSGYNQIVANHGAFSALKADGSITSWGAYHYLGIGEAAPTDNGYTQIFSNSAAFAALKADGSITAWGNREFGGEGAPTDSGYTRIFSTYAAFAALKADGSITAWGRWWYGARGAPTDSGYTTIVAAERAFAALKADGSIAAWGDSRYSAGAPTDTGYTAIYANNNGFTAIKADGSVSGWGSYRNTALTTPTDAGYTRIFSTRYSFAALKADGSITAWGDISSGGTGAPTDNGYTKIFSTSRAFAAMKADGSITAWGERGFGANGAPTDNGYVHIVSIHNTFLAVKADDSVNVWGAWGHYSRNTGPPDVTDYVSINGSSADSGSSCGGGLSGSGNTPAPIRVSIEHSGSSALYCPATVSVSVYRGDELATDFTGQIQLSHSQNGAGRWASHDISGVDESQGVATLAFSAGDQGQKQVDFTWLQDSIGSTTLLASVEGENFAADQALELSTVALNITSVSGYWAYAEQGINLDLEVLSSQLNASGQPICARVTEVNGSQTLEARSVLPNRGGLAPFSDVSLNGNTLPRDGSATTFSHSFNQGQTSLRLSYADLGLVDLRLRLPRFSEMNVAGLPQRITILPKQLRLQLTTPAQKPALGGLLPAGSTFEARLEALGDQGQVLPSWGQLGYVSDLSQFTLHSSVGNLVPSSDANPDLKQETLSKQGTQVNFSARYDEVGTVSVKLSPKLGALFSGQPSAFPIVSQHLSIGDFYPAYYQVSAGSVTQGQLRQQLTDKTYLGHTQLPLLDARVELRAYNAQGVLLDHLTRLSTLSESHISVPSTVPLQATQTQGISVDSAQSHAHTHVDANQSTNRYTLRFSAQLRLQRMLASNGSLPAPFTPTVHTALTSFGEHYGVESRQIDGSVISSSNPLLLPIESGQWVYAKAKVLDGRGGALQRQTLGLDILYFDGTSFVKSTTDSSTVFTLGAAQDSDVNDGFDFSDATWQAGLSNTATASGGELRFTLPSLPEDNHWGKVKLPFNGTDPAILEQLGLPLTGHLLATYGIYRASEQQLEKRMVIIYRRY